MDEKGVSSWHGASGDAPYVLCRWPPNSLRYLRVGMRGFCLGAGNITHIRIEMQAQMKRKRRRSFVVFFFFAVIRQRHLGHRTTVYN